MTSSLWGWLKVKERLGHKNQKGFSKYKGVCNEARCRPESHFNRPAIPLNLTNLTEGKIINDPHNLTWTVQKCWTISQNKTGVSDDNIIIYWLLLLLLLRILSFRLKELCLEISAEFKDQFPVVFLLSYFNMSDRFLKKCLSVLFLYLNIHIWDEAAALKGHIIHEYFLSTYRYFTYVKILCWSISIFYY